MDDNNLSKLKHEWILCGYSAEKVICDVNCVACNSIKRKQAIEKFRSKYYVKKGKVLPIKSNIRKKSTI